MSGDLDGVVEVVGDVRGEGDDEVAAEGVGDSGERVKAVPGAAAFVEAGDDGLGGAHALGEFALAEFGLGAQVVDELSEGEVLFDGVAGLGAGGGALVRDVGPAGVVGHRRGPCSSVGRPPSTGRLGAGRRNVPQMCLRAAYLAAHLA